MGISPLRPDEFAALMSGCGFGAVPGFQDQKTAAVAVSGGADSMALALLLGEWAAMRGITLHALTVDHGLRPESTQEAQQVGQWLSAHGLNHHILRWNPPQPLTGNLQDTARRARYGLMTDWCRTYSVDMLFVAHQQEDQAETLLMRLERGSGLQGLAAMAPVSRHESGIWLMRPLLEVPKARLRALLQAQDQEWVEEPSNQDLRYRRNHLRQVMAEWSPDPERLTHRLAATAAQLREAHQLMQQLLVELLSRCVTLSPMGVATLEASALIQAPAALHHPALVRLCQTVGGSAASPRRAQTIRLMTALEEGRAHSLCRALFRPVTGKPGQWHVLREQTALPVLPLPASSGECLWDGRFRLRWRAMAEEGVSIGPLSAGGEPLFKEIPAMVRAALPAFYHAERVLVAPLPTPGYGMSRAAFTVEAAFAPFHPLLPPLYNVEGLQGGVRSSGSHIIETMRL